MSTHINYVHRQVNSRGELPIETTTINRGSTDGGDPILLTLARNELSDDPTDLVVTIDTIHAPQDFADFMATVLHGMTGTVDGITCTLVPRVAPEPASVTQTEPTGHEVLTGEVVE